MKIWKYASCFVVRVDDLKLFDCAGIQVTSFSIVVDLDPKPIFSFIRVFACSGTR